MGLGRVTSNSLTQVNLHKTNKQVGWHKVGAPLVLGRATSHMRLRTHKTHHGLDSGEATTFPPYNILCTTPREWHPYGFLSIQRQGWESRNFVGL
jgi:hypothetical protein